MLLAGLLVGSYTVSFLPLVPFPFSFSFFLSVCLSVLETGSDSVALADLELRRPGCPRTHGDPAASPCAQISYLSHTAQTHLPGEGATCSGLGLLP